MERGCETTGVCFHNFQSWDFGTGGNDTVCPRPSTGGPHAVPRHVHKGQLFLIRVMMSVTWSYVALCSRIIRWVLSTAWMTVVWSRPPNKRAIAG